MKFYKPLLMICFICAQTEAGWLDRKAEGWAWHEKKQKEESVQDEVSEPIDSKSSKEQIAEVKEKLEELLATALISPTEENIYAYMQLQYEWLEKSSNFSQMWAKTLLNSPQLNSSVTDRPTTQYGIQLHKHIKKSRMKELIQSLCQDHGLFLFYEGGSKISQALSMVLLEFSKQYNWEIVPISIDGIMLEAMPTSRIDNGLSHNLGITVFPAVFIINPMTKEATPIAYGLASLDQILQNISLQFEDNGGEHGY